TREIMNDSDYLVGRVIALPFIGEPGHFVRTAKRQDYALKPFGRTVMNALKDADYDVIALGKISDIYVGEGITKSLRTVSNMDGMDKLLDTRDMEFTGLSFLNLVDFDAKYGHRRDPKGYGEALEAFDKRLPHVLELLTEDDRVVITAEHGYDPTCHGTDQIREDVPLLAYQTCRAGGTSLPIRQTFVDVGMTIADKFQVDRPEHGECFLNAIIGGGICIPS